MINLKFFKFRGDHFYRDVTFVPLNIPGITFFKGINLDAGNSDEYSNGTGKTRLPQILSSFIYGGSERGHFKKMVFPDFEGTLEFTNTRTETDWSFTYNLKDNHWTILCNSQPYLLDHHKPSECQKFLAEQIGYNKKEWSNFVHINRQSINTLMRGDPSERRKYLESFFNIDEFYEEKRREYYELKSSLEDKLHLLSQDRARLGQVLESLKSLDTEEFVQVQLEGVDSGIAHLTAEQQKSLVTINSCRTALDVWDKYYASCVAVETLPALSEVRNRLTEVSGKLAEIKSKKEKQITAKQKKAELDLYASLICPETPQIPEPDTEVIIALEKIFTQMQEKVKLINKFKLLRESLPKVSGDVPELEKLVSSLRAEKAEAEHHLLLVGDGTKCSRCGHDLEFVAGDPEETRKVLLEQKNTLVGKIKEIEQQIVEIRKADVIKKQMAEVKEDLEALPVFGKKPEEIKTEIAEKKSAIGAWREYNEAKIRYEKKLHQKQMLLTELAALGHPDILSEDLTNSYTELTTQYRELKEQETVLVHHDKLMTEASELKPRKELEAAFEDETVAVEFYRQALPELLQRKGEYKSQLEQIRGLEDARLELESRLADSEDLMREYRLVEGLVKFFSPAGFKVYELRKRCEFLIEKANFWSPSFFQEQYEWSLPDDLDALEFLVQPIKHKKTPPYPVSQLSAGEENRAEKVLLFSQLELSPNNKLNVLFLDEIEGYLDKAGKTFFVEVVIPKLKDTFPDRSIILISHEESLKRSYDIDHMWLAERKNRVTSLKTFENYNRGIPCQ